MTPEQLIAGAREGRKFRWTEGASDETPTIRRVMTYEREVEGVTEEAVDVIAYASDDGIVAARYDRKVRPFDGDLRAQELAPGDTIGDRTRVLARFGSMTGALNLLTGPVSVELDMSRNGLLGLNGATKIEWVDDDDREGGDAA